MMPNLIGNARKPKEIPRPTNPSIQKVKKPYHYENKIVLFSGPFFITIAKNIEKINHFNFIALVAFQLFRRKG